MQDYKNYTIKCADCAEKKVFSARTVRGLCEILRDNGWAVNANNDTFWCPNHAGNHRNVGKGGAKQSAVKPFIQIKLDI